jgi:hypothetical protein
LLPFALALVPQAQSIRWVTRLALIAAFGTIVRSLCQFF